MTYEYATFIDAARQMVTNQSIEFQAFRIKGVGKLTGNCRDKRLNVYYIFVDEHYRGKGLIRAFFNQLHTLNVDSVAVLAVQSTVLDQYLQRFVCPVTGAKFVMHGSDFLLEFPRR